MMLTGHHGFSPLLFAAAILLPLAPQASARLAGYHVDVESCSGLIQDNATAQVAQCATFFGQLANMSAALKAAALPGPPLRLSVDVGTAWVCPTGATNCVNMTYNGVNKSVAEHVVDIADEVVLMDYSRDADDVVSRARLFLQYANGGGTAVRVGVAIAGPGAAAPASWQTRNESELLALQAAAHPKLASFDSFNGFAVFVGGLWRAHAAGPPPAAFPSPSGVWYIDHKAVLNTTLRADYLAWATSRRVDEIYIAPHAGADALISVPGQSGSPANDKAFCDFVWEADKLGIDVQLLSSPETDMAWLRNCTGRAASVASIAAPSTTAPRKTLSQ